MRALISLSALTLAAGRRGSQPPAPEQNPAGVESRTASGVRLKPRRSTEVKPDAAFDPNSIAALKDPRSPLQAQRVFRLRQLRGQG
jgi:hypothetical protein